MKKFSKLLKKKLNHFFKYFSNYLFQKKKKKLRNPDSPFTWRYVGARINPRRAQKIKKIVLLFFVHYFINIFGEN